MKDKLIEESNLIQSNVASIPSQEKNLRSIERNQQIKEALYLFLLQKGEEAQVSYAVTEPSIKIVEYAISSLLPISPRTKVNYLVALFIGFFLPFIIIGTVPLLKSLERFRRPAKLIVFIPSTVIIFFLNAHNCFHIACVT